LAGRVQSQHPEAGTMLIKVYGGTSVQEAESLCDTCRHSRIVRGRRLDEEIVMCGAIMMGGARITFKVASCTDYLDDREPSYHELFEKAWILRPASRRRPAGFVRAADLDDRDAARLSADPLEED
jgi:hypothetical protein